MNGRSPAKPAVEGVVSARPCSCCGHHEIGILTAAGEYIPLRLGMRVRILDHGDAPESHPQVEDGDASTRMQRTT